MTRVCKTCLDQSSQKKTNSRQSNIDFESAREVLMEEDYKMVAERRFEGIYNSMECKSYIKRKIILKTKRYFLLDSNMLEQIQSIII